MIVAFIPDAILVNLTFRSALLNLIMSEITVMIWSATAYYEQFQLLRTVGNLNRTGTISEMLEPQTVPFEGFVELYFNALPYAARNVPDFFSEHLQLLL